jgi:uncharacterized protein
MKWLGGRESDNVEFGSGGGGWGGGRLLGGGLGAGVIGLIIYLLTGQDPNQQVLPRQSGGGDVVEHYHGPKGSPENFASVVLAETEDIWDSLFRVNGAVYEKPKLHLYEGVVASACGTTSNAVGPFYCPEDQKIYLDVSFFNELRQRFGAPGDFANAYVIAHEVGHHIQKLMGTTDRVGHLAHQRGANGASVAMELQADFYAGVWAHFAEQRNSPDNPIVIDRGDIDAALNAASAIGDDRLQQETNGRVMPDAFTHGTSRQRQYWFNKGYTTGDIKQGNTFGEMAE